jgi:hypothetical protein
MISVGHDTTFHDIHNYLSMERWPLILMLTMLLCTIAIAQTHYKSVSNTGNNATIGIPSSINPTVDGSLLDVNDEIAVFADGWVIPDSFCVGVAKWTGKNISIIVWGDNEQTSIIDGIRASTKFHFHIWKSSTTTEYTNAAVTYAQGDSLYRVNGIYILATLSAGTLQALPTIIIESTHNTLTKQFDLRQNFPNPFNPSTNIEFTASADGHAVLKVYNAAGQEVAELFHGEVHAGRIVQTHFNAAQLASGIYYSRLDLNGNNLVKRMLFIK